MQRRSLGSRVSLLLVGLVAVALSMFPVSPVTAQGVALLNDVQAQDMGTFDRVTFTFEGGVPEILAADYFDGPAANSPSGELVTPAVGGDARMMIVMGTASGFDLSVSPPRQVYTGPRRFSPGLPTVVELVQVEDFEATLGWVIAVRGGEVPFEVSVLSDPTRVVVDFRHVEVVIARPSFTG